MPNRAHDSPLYRVRRKYRYLNRNPVYRYLFSLVPSITLALVGYGLLQLLNWQESRVLSRDLSQASTLARFIIQKAVVSVDSASVILGTLKENDKSTLSHASQTKLHGLSASARFQATTALTVLRSVDSLALVTGTPGSARLAVEIGESIGLDQVVTLAQKRVADAPFIDSTATLAARTAWVSAARYYHDALEGSSRSIVCANATALSLPNPTPPSCPMTDSAFAQWVADTTTSYPPDLRLTDGFRARNHDEFLIKLFFALAFVLIGGGLIVLLARLTGMVDPKSSVDDVVAAAASRSLGRPILSMWPLIAPLGLAAGVAAGGYALAKPSLNREPMVVRSAHATSFNNALSFNTSDSTSDSTAFAKIQATLKTIGDSVDSISHRAQ